MRALFHVGAPGSDRPSWRRRAALGDVVHRGTGTLGGAGAVRRAGDCRCAGACRPAGARLAGGALGRPGTIIRWGKARRTLLAVAAHLPGVFDQLHKLAERR
ncbi:MAG: hypothetical protein ABS52_05820 [Gemmatimonadetes bacterium SCN 70-22]|nr:MAG: hypothetical protein ABS52_05820 [Gemmatimonadetes bacterium SCN 70-22]